MKIKLLISVVLYFCIFVKSQENEPVYFVQITDTHLGVDDHNDKMKTIVQSINKLSYDISCVVHTGDIFQNNIMNYEVVKEALDIFSNLKVPIHFVPGNHDILYYEYEDNLKQYLTYFNYTDTVVTYNGLTFVFVYTESLRGDKITGEKNTLNILEEYLEQYKDSSKIVLHHAPSVEDFYNNKIHEGWDKMVYNKWVALLNYYDVVAVIAGHFHRGELHWLKNVPLFVAPSVAGYWGRQASYRIYEYKNGKLSYWTVYID